MSLYSSAILSDSPRAYWRLGELSGTSAADASGDAHGGTYTGTFALGQAGAVACDNNPAAKFDGSTAWVSLPALGRLTQWTIEAWAKLNGNQVSDSCILADKFGGASVNFALNTNRGGAGGLVVDAGYFNGGAWHTTAGVALASLAWHHIAGTYDGANIILYIDGAVAASASATSPTTDGLGHGIARRPDAATFFNGWIDEVAIYGAALSPARILAHYNAGINQPPAAGVIGASLVKRGVS